MLVQHCQQLQRTPVVRTRGHEVVRPDVAPIQRPQPDARSVVEPQPTSLRLPLRDLQPLLPPDPLHPLVVHPPALDAEHVRDASVAVAAESDSRVARYHLGAPPRHSPLSSPGAGSCVAARAPGTLSSPTPRAADVHAPHNVVGARGSEVSLGRFLQDQLVQCQVRHCSLQAPCLAHLHPAVLPPPPVVRLLGDAELPADQLHGFAAGQTDLCLPQCTWSRFRGSGQSQ